MASSFPDATTTGVPADVDLKPSESLVITTPGAVIEGLDINGSVTIAAPDVTLKNCSITSGDYSVVLIKPGMTGVTVQNCNIDNQGTGGQGIAGQGSFLSNNIQNCADGIDVRGDNTLIQDNFIHDMNGTSDSHFDGIQADGGFSNLTIAHNTVINEQGQTSALMLDNYWGPIDNVTIDNNLLIGGGYTTYINEVADGQAGGGPVTNVSFTNNHLGSGTYGTLDLRTELGHQPAISGNTNDGMALSDSLQLTGQPTSSDDVGSADPGGATDTGDDAGSGTDTGTHTGSGVDDGNGTGADNGGTGSADDTGTSGTDDSGTGTSTSWDNHGHHGDTATHWGHRQDHDWGQRWDNDWGHRNNSDHTSNATVASESAADTGTPAPSAPDDTADSSGGANQDSFVFQNHSGTNWGHQHNHDWGHRSASDFSFDTAAPLDSGVAAGTPAASTAADAATSSGEANHDSFVFGSQFGHSNPWHHQAATMPTDSAKSQPSAFDQIANNLSHAAQSGQGVDVASQAIDHVTHRDAHNAGHHQHDFHVG